MLRAWQKFGLSILALASLICMATGQDVPDVVKQGNQTSNDQVVETEVPVAPQNVADELTLDEVNKAVSDLDQNSNLESAVKELLRAKYVNATESLKQANQYRELADQFRNANAEGPQKKLDLKDEIEMVSSVEEAKKDAESFIADIGADEIQQKVDLQQTTVATLKDTYEKTSKSLSNLKIRTTEIAKRLPEAESDLDAAKAKLKSPDLAPDNTSPSRTADRAVATANVINLRSEVEMLTQEQMSEKTREDLLQAQTDLLAKKVANEEAILDIYRATRNASLVFDAQEYDSRLKRIGENITESDTRAELLNDVKSLSQDYRSIVDDLILGKRASENINSRYERLQEESDYLATQISYGGSGEVIAQLIYEMQDRILRRGVDKSMLDKLPTLDRIRLQEIEHDQIRRSSEDFARQFDGLEDGVSAELLLIRGELINKLKRQYSVVIKLLSSIQRDLDRYNKLAENVLETVRTQLFWIRSYPAVSVSTFTEFPKGLSWVFGRKQIEGFGTAIYFGFKKYSSQFFLASIILAALIILRPRLISRLKKTGEQVRRISTDKYRYTFIALACTVLLALPLPMAFVLVGWALEANPGTSNYLHGIADGLHSSSWITIILGFIIATNRPSGLAISHFRWDKQDCEQFRFALIAFGIAFIPALLITTGTIYGNNASQYGDSVGRICFMAVQVWIAFLFWRWLGAESGFVAHLVKQYPEWLVTKLRFIWYPILLLFPIGLILLVWIGFFYTAIELSLLLVATFGIIAVAEVMMAMTLRWYSCKKRKLALAQVLERRRLRREAALAEGNENEEVVSVDPEEEVGLDLDVIGEQTKHVFRMIFAVIVILSVSYLWSEALPIYAALANIKVPFTTSFSLLAAIQSALIVIITWVLVQNLPGLLDLSLLRTLSFKPGTRYAISRICQYVTTGIGLLALFSVLQVDWSKFGWIAAALSVGLGFGLQEVVANFVCGLILLFERPVRVGDIVTLDGITGTVTNIQMRSTTLTNWDRQEFIVPNKQLITGTILNWTLSASVNRVVIPVGVAYGSDTDRAREIMLDVATGHPLVMDEPGPSTSFEQFADSALTLILRAYLPDMDNRLKVISELHTEINNRFAEEGLEIAFPQLDIHLRTETNSDGKSLLSSEQSFD